VAQQVLPQPLTWPWVAVLPAAAGPCQIPAAPPQQHGPQALLLLLLLLAASLLLLLQVVVPRLTMSPVR
jgi:hypothetical protein